MGHALYGENSAQAQPHQTRTQGSFALRLPRYPENVLRGPRVALHHPQPGAAQDPSEPHPAGRQHAHRTQGQREEADSSTSQFPITFPKVRPFAIGQRGPTARQSQRGIDADQVGPRAYGCLQDFPVVVEGSSQAPARLVDLAEARRSSRTSGEIQADHGSRVGRPCREDPLPMSTPGSGDHQPRASDHEGMRSPLGGE